MVGIVQWDYGQVSPKFRGGENWGLSSSIMDGHAQLDLEALEGDILINYLVIISRCWLYLIKYNIINYCYFYSG